MLLRDAENISSSCIAALTATFIAPLHINFAGASPPINFVAGWKDVLSNEQGEGDSDAPQVQPVI